MSSTLSPAVVAAIDDLELAARLVVEGSRAGAHRSPFHGYSADFQQHRPYRQGDDLKYLDWKVLARTDRLYTRRFRETTAMSVMLVLDTSASMAFPASVPDKFAYSRILAAALAWLISAQGDSVGVLALSGGALEYLPARGGRPHLRSALALIDRLRPGGMGDPVRVIGRAADLLKRRGVVMVVSDFYDAEEETRRELRRVLRRGHDVGMLQVLSLEELSLPFRGELEFQDLETGERRLVDAAGAGAQYREAVTAFLARCREEAHRDGVDHALFRTDESPARALRDYLLRRGARRVSSHAGGLALP
jgi:uncharacterized protein (DUF58 family)